MKYRPEIDGLRFIAVLAVMLFHADVKFFKGGFVGVDIFFVISGFLITTIILNQLSRNEFVYTKFIERRARRILPAFLFVIWVCSLSFPLFFDAGQLKFFYQSVASAALFISNLFFKKNSDYFDPLSSENPVLHTWSLSIEEQFYLIFPIILIVTFKYVRKHVFEVLLFIALSSLIASECLLQTNPKGSYYLIYSRAFELLIGSLAALLKFKNPRVTNKKVASLGLLVSISSVFVFSEHTRFPGLWALLPCGGVAAFVLFSEAKSFSTKILSNKVVVRLGVLSYSAYLWHQPVFVAYRTNFDFNEWLSIPLIGVSFGLAALTREFVEKPFLANSKTKITTGWFNILALLICLITASVALAVSHSNLYSLSTKTKKFTEEQNSMLLKFAEANSYNMYDKMTEHLSPASCHQWSKDWQKLDVKKIQKCRAMGKQIVLLFGGSHAMNLFKILSIQKSRSAIVSFSQGYCRLSDWVNACKPTNVLYGVKKLIPHVDKVIYHQAGKVLWGVDADRNWINLQTNLLELKKISQDKLQVYGPWLEAHKSLHQIVEGGPKLKVSREHEALGERVDQKFIRFSRRIGIKYTSLLKLFYDDLSSIVVGDCLMFKDESHISRCGERYLAEKHSQKLMASLN